MGNVCCDPKIHKGRVCEVSDLRTGDVLFARDPAFSKAGACAAQGCLCWSINHTGIAIAPGDFSIDGNLWKRNPDMNPGKRYMLHALMSGIRIWDIDPYLQKMLDKGPPSGHLYVRQLVSTKGLGFEKEIADSLDEYFGTIQDKEYEGNMKTMVTGYFDSCEPCLQCCENRGDHEDLFCSELVAGAYQQAGVLKDDRSADEFMPTDFLNSDGTNVEKTSLMPGYSLGPVTEVEGFDYEFEAEETAALVG
mmetsp:Transcript_10620/g.19679  ORF Transcript_10620/g.19679 Transcript_10620/m.19679 type:complete len:249 (+) Transcript_10620:35-781(+)